jgi:hypothetical protein
MEKEIVYTDKYALILDMEKDIEENMFTLKDGKIIEVSYLGQDNGNAIIAHLPLSDAPILEGVPLLPSFSCGQQDDVEELAKEEYPIGDDWDDIESLVRKLAFKKGYNKAKEKYKYTEEDLKLAMNWLFETKGRKGFEDLIERLNQPSRPTHFECEMEDYGHYEIGVDDFVKHGERPKTTTNSQGQVELVGKYI